MLFSQVLIGSTLMPIFKILIFYFIVYYIYIKYIKKDNKTQVKNIDKTIYYRDIPCSNNIEYAYWLLYNFSNYKKEELNNGLISAYLLKWYKNGYITIEHTTNNNCNIDLKEGNWEKTVFEDELYDFLKDAAGNNNILEKNEIRNYCSIEGDFKLELCFDSLTRDIEKRLVDNNYVKIEGIRRNKKIVLSNEAIQDYQNLIGLKNFLLNYSNINTKEDIEIQIWEDYLIFANLLGIADKIEEQYKKIYPDLDFDKGMFLYTKNMGIIEGTINTILKIHFIYVLVTFIVFVLIFLLLRLPTENFLKIVKIFIYGIIIVLLFYYLRKYYINKKVREMNKKIYAKIIEVEKEEHTKYDSDLKKDITTITYFFKYEYTVNGTQYKGCEYTDAIINVPKVGKKIKIYYNELKPQKSTTASVYNQYLKKFIITLIVLYIVNRIIK